LLALMTLTHHPWMDSQSLIFFWMVDSFIQGVYQMKPKKNCEKCGSHRNKTVRHAENGMKLKGWYCPVCQNFDSAIGREKKL
jgi:hypothetical protein